MTTASDLPRLPWLAQPLRQALSTQRGHALLIHGPRGVGQFELSLALAQGWLCESETVPLESRPCDTCASCRLVRARSHPDLLVLVPEAMRESVGWGGAAGEGEEGGEPAKGAKKPSKEIRVETIRAAIGFATTTSARGRGKVLVVHPAERMNDVAANAFLKTLEEPAGAARFVLSSAAPDALLPTIRSRCQAVALPVPPPDEAAAWLGAQGVADAALLLRACGGQPQEVLAWAALGLDANAWQQLPGKVARGDAAALHGLPLPVVVEILQKLCHDESVLACGGRPRFFVAESLIDGAELTGLLRWSRELSRVAAEAEHPWLVDLSVESLVEQGRQALKTARSGQRPARSVSLNSPR
ncbi:MAG TPA: DNA polymerase III subunit delta' [Caldimonas sp.]|jgi:DNA polymerase-3 subunit delta'|nr:DNA polymerase III subunit delta' [Caldimonas sp.]HEX2541542.1 DNA polymerase III subunit delta' [Caldimonas sp.]